MERARPTVVVHLAWAASGTPDYRHAADNERWLQASLELARACTATGATLVATGTAIDKAGSPADAYSASKAALWRAFEPAVTAHDLTWVRPYYVFDEERRRPALVAHAVAARAAGRPVALRTPDSEHDFIHAADVGLAIVEAVRHDLRGEVPIGSGRLRRVQDLIAALGIPWVAEGEPQTGGVEHLSEAADTSRLGAVGWAPERTNALFASRPGTEH